MPSRGQAPSIRRVLEPDDQRRAQRRRAARRQALAYQGAFESVFAILIGAGFGYLADAKFGTVPWGLLSGLVLGFCAFVLRLFRLTRQLEEMAEAERDLPER